jgi:hypothetical protein
MKALYPKKLSLLFQSIELTPSSIEQEIALVYDFIYQI